MTSADRPDATGLREAVEALAETWADFEHDAVACTKYDCGDCTMVNAVYDLRAVLAAHPESPEADPTAGERCEQPRHRRPHATWGDDPSGHCGCAGCDGCPCAPAEPDAGDAEALARLMYNTDLMHDGWASAHPQAKEAWRRKARHIIASDWLAADRAATAERIAQAIGVNCRSRHAAYSSQHLCFRCAEAARIARGEG